MENGQAHYNLHRADGQSLAERLRDVGVEGAGPGQLLPRDATEIELPYENENHYDTCTKGLVSDVNILINRVLDYLEIAKN